MAQSESNAARSWLAHISLRRIITSNRFIPEIDGFRFLAILIVILSHIMLQCEPPQGQGLIANLFRQAFFEGVRGVYLFFTISGFILALPFARHHLQGTKPVALGSYFKRRITRLEPPYILVMLLRATALLFTGLGPILIGTHLLASLLYLNNLIFVQYPLINRVAWSLEIEIQFYVLAPLLTMVFLIRSPVLRRTVIVAAILASTLGASFFIWPFGRLALTLLNFFQYFAAGFLLCDLYLSKAHLSLPAFVWDILGAAALLWILFSQSHFYSLVLPFATVCLYMAGFYGRIVRGFFSLRAISTIGGMCYSLYLTHAAVLSGMHFLLTRASVGSWPATLQAATIYLSCLVAVLAVGTLYFILIERPCMDPNWPRQLADRFARRNPAS